MHILFVLIQLGVRTLSTNWTKFDFQVDIDVDFRVILLRVGVISEGIYKLVPSSAKKNLTILLFVQLQRNALFVVLQEKVYFFLLRNSSRTGDRGIQSRIKD